MAARVPNINISSDLFEKVRMKFRSALLLMGEHDLPLGVVELRTKDEAAGKILVKLSAVLHRRLDDMPLRVLEEIGQPSLDALMKHVRNTDPGATQASKATFIEWSEVLRDEGESVAHGTYGLTQDEMLDLLKALRPFVEMAQAAKANSTGRIPPGNYTITPLRLAGACSAYHTLDRLRRKGPDKSPANTRE